MWCFKVYNFAKMHNVQKDVTEKVHFRSQILERPSIGEYWNNLGVPVLSENVIFTFFRMYWCYSEAYNTTYLPTYLPVSIMHICTGCLTGENPPNSAVLSCHLCLFYCPAKSQVSEIPLDDVSPLCPRSSTPSPPMGWFP